MTTRILIMKRLISSFCWLLPAACLAGSYSIDWHTIAGGGGTGTNGQYTLSGTIGQHDAGTAMSGGNYSLTGGLWAIYALQTPGAPLLTIVLTTTNTAIVSWPSSSGNFNLQVNTDLSTTNWTAPLETTNDDGTNKFIIVTPITGNRFYRLKFP